jgi:uncharacterized protein YndB with AHSA1/START domain
MYKENAMVEKNGTTYSVSVEILVPAPIEEAWACFMDPKKSAEFFFGISFVSDLQVGGSITWSGEWEGKPFKDTGTILELRAPRLFRYDYFSNFSGEPDLPENHYQVSYSFDPVPDGVRVAIRQSNAKTKESAEHSEKNWSTMLEAVKGKLESRR